MSYQALLFCPDDKTARVVTQVLTELDFAVEPCNEPFAAVKKLMAQHYDAIVVDCDNEQNAALLFKSAKNSTANQSSLSVAVVEGQAGVAKAFRIGANLVLTKPINVEQSKGTLRVARGLLRKAESSKPAGSSAVPQEHPATPAATAPSSARPFAPLTPALKGTPAFASPKAPPAAVVPVATQSGFEVENDPVPAPDSTEAALLESMPDPVSPVSQPHRPPAGSAKEYPWQPMAKPISEPMASALRRAEEAANKPTVTSHPGGTEEGLSLGDHEPSSQNAGAATAPAKEKETVRPTLKPFPSTPVVVTPTIAPVDDEAETQTELEPGKVVTIPSTAPAIEPPTFSAYSIKDHEEIPAEGSGRNKMLLVVAAAVIIAAGYFGWTKMHSGEPSGTPKQVASARPQGSAQSVVQPSPSSQELAGAAQGSPSEIVEAPSQSQHATGSASTKPSPATKAPSAAAIASPVDREPEVIVRQAQPEPLVVKNEVSGQRMPKPAAAEAPQVAAPDALGFGANSDEKTISGLVSNASVSVPRAVAQQTVRVSQGVSQGLLSKRVQPVYPAQAMQMRVQGAVQLQATIAKDGSVANLKVLSGDGMLSRAAIEAVRQWQYKPYYLNGEPIEIQTQITVNFKLP
jgi:periplasmic protein TonB